MSIESKWREKWNETNDFETNPNEKEKKFITVAYPYPNSPQHIGHGRTYTLADVHARFYQNARIQCIVSNGFPLYWNTNTWNGKKSRIWR